MNVGRMESKLAVNRVSGFARTNPKACDRRRIPRVLEKRDQRLSLRLLRKKTHCRSQVIYVSPEPQLHPIPRSATVMPSDTEGSSHSRSPRS
jgi:hypothetical protein